MNLHLARLLAIAAVLAGCAHEPVTRATLLETCWRAVEIEGKTLELHDSESKVRMRIDARDLK